MILGLSLILIVVIPFCIYLYITNQKLTKKIKELESEKRYILERKIIEAKEKDAISINLLSNMPQSTKPKPKKKNTKNNYLKKVSNEINKNIEENNIKLTKFEQEQEEQAIISYQELKQLEKNKEEPKEIKEIKEEEQTEDFINNLKQFRKNLKDKEN